MKNKMLNKEYRKIVEKHAEKWIEQDKFNENQVKFNKQVLKAIRELQQDMKQLKNKNQKKSLNETLFDSYENDD